MSTAWSMHIAPTATMRRDSESGRRPRSPTTTYTIGGTTSGGITSDGHDGSSGVAAKLRSASMAQA